MLSFRRAKGTIECTLLSLSGITRNEKQFVRFESGDKIPGIMFSQEERFYLILKIREEGRKSPLTKITSYSQKGELAFSVFIKGVQRASFTGSHVFSVSPWPLDPGTQEYSFTFDRVAINQGMSGAAGWMKIVLKFKFLS